MSATNFRSIIVIRVVPAEDKSFHSVRRRHLKTRSLIPTASDRNQGTGLKMASRLRRDAFIAVLEEPRTRGSSSTAHNVTK